MLIIGMGIIVAVMGCASTQDRERRALSEEFDKWLGQYKDTRIIERGPPDRCVAQGEGAKSASGRSMAIRCGTFTTRMALRDVGNIWIANWER